MSFSRSCAVCGISVWLAVSCNERSILPTAGPDPNQHDNLDRDRAVRAEEDPHWKELAPRWPLSADGQWYWKADTSSDELDGHYFLYAVYHDLVAETAEEKARVRQVVYDITTHLIEHDYALVDHDGQPTRWARYHRDVLDHGHLIDGRGLNSLSNDEKRRLNELSKRLR